MFFSFLRRGRYAFAMSVFLVSSISFWFVRAPVALAIECICPGSTVSRDAADAAACTALCSRISSGSREGGSCLCSDGSNPGISGADLANCCRACSGRGGSGPAQGVSLNGASQSCPVAGATKTETGGGGYGLIDPLGSKDIPQILGGIVRAAIGFVGALFLLFFVWGGALWMTAGGDAEKVKTAQKAIRNAVLGMMVVIFAYVLIDAIIGISSSVQPSSSETKKTTTTP